MGFHVFSVISVVFNFKQKPQSFHADVVNRMPGLVEVVGDRFVPVVLDVSQVFLKMGVKLASSFADVEFGAFSAMDDVHDVVCQAIELFGDVHL